MRVMIGSLQAKLCYHTDGLLYANGQLEATSDVRSVPLGEKRRKGRPKKIPHSLQKSPARSPVEVSPDDGDDVPATEDIAHDILDNENGVSTPGEYTAPEPRKTTRKRKRQVEKNSPVDAIAGQSKPVGPGLGQAKPPKKKPRTHEDTQTDIQKPSGVQCKKKRGGCNHEIVFDIHYNKKLWDRYAESVRSKKSRVEIDPNYVA
jgi:hypothetical protein